MKINKLKKFLYKLIMRKEIKNQKDLNGKKHIDDAWKEIISLGNPSRYYNLKKSFKYSIKHSGHVGDIIYALPIIQSLAKNSLSGSVDFYLALGADSGFTDKMHPNGQVRLNESTFNSLKPLLEIQSQISSVSIYDNESMDFDLDDFRKYIPYLDKGNISKWYQYLIPLDIDLVNPWLTVKKNSIASDSILISRSLRYQMTGISYRYLKKYKQVYFVGVEKEYKRLKPDIPKLQWLETKNFLELAQVIAGAKLFIGNQSSPFAIAESLKVNRILETNLTIPNVIPVGGRSIQCCLQNRLEYATDLLFNS